MSLVSLEGPILKDTYGLEESVLDLGILTVGILKDAPKSLKNYEGYLYLEDSTGQAEANEALTKYENFVKSSTAFVDPNCRRYYFKPKVTQKFKRDKIEQGLLEMEKILKSVQKTRKDFETALVSKASSRDVAKFLENSANELTFYILKDNILKGAEEPYEEYTTVTNLKLLANYFKTGLATTQCELEGLW